MSPITLICLALFPAALIVAALWDLTSFTIPNWISLALVAAFAPAAFAAHPPMGVLLGCLATGGGALLLGMVMFSLGWIGGGDAKLFAAAAPVAGLACGLALHGVDLRGGRRPGGGASLQPQVRSGGSLRRPSLARTADDAQG